MRSFFSAAPGVIWAAVIVALVLAAEWLTQYFGGQAWVPPVAGLLTAVIVPVLRLLAQGELPAGAPRGTRAAGAHSRLARWLW